MHIYSNTVIKFISDVKTEIRRILSAEVGYKVARERFYDKSGRYSYPINVVMFNHRAMLGYFDSEFYEMGFHEKLMYCNKSQLHNIIRHELAHYLAFINKVEMDSVHGPEFRKLCESFGWGEEVYRASTTLEINQNAECCEADNILRKVQKLMSLASSSNQHEAELAMIKSQQLLLKHHIESKYLGHAEEEKVHLKRLMRQKKQTAKMGAIAQILKTFFVNVIFSRSSEYIYLEILGTQVNIEIAEYVAEFLDNELERLWLQAKSEYSGLKGTVAKNSFLLGLAKGYCNKVEALKREYNAEATKALMVIEKMLVDAKEMVYSRLRNTKSSGSYCPASSSIGESLGRAMNIKTGVGYSSSDSTKFLPNLR